MPRMSMTGERWQQIVSYLRGRARAVRTSEREAFLAEACAGDVALRQEVESLLAQERDDQPSRQARVGRRQSARATAARASARSIGVYRVEGVIGAGGMGQVYRAKDTKLGRSVALKVLPDVFATDPERRARFQREAQVLAALNHPNIGAIHGLRRHGHVSTRSSSSLSKGRRSPTSSLQAAGSGFKASRRDSRAGVPLDDALNIARQIVDALEARTSRGSSIAI